MARERTYLDHNATAPLRPAARDAMVACLDAVGNPSSVHREGRRARSIVEAARAEVAALVGGDPRHVTFTSGATEAAALALAPAKSEEWLLVGATEHAAVLQGHRFAVDRVVVLPVDGNGVIDLAALDRALSRRDAAASLVAVQVANSETGVLQPVAAVAAIAHRHGTRLVCDAAQAAGRIDCRFETLGADALILSGHKLGGPQGTGALVLASDTVRIGVPLWRGGGQERGLRGGTENVAALAGFGAAARQAAEASDAPRLRALRDDLERRLDAMAPEAIVFGEAAERLPNTTAFAVPGLANETLLIGLDLEGVAVSTGSACSSGKVARSRVLEAMGVDAHLSGGMARASLGWSSTARDIDRFVGALETVLARLRSRDVRAAA